MSLDNVDAVRGPTASQAAGLTIVAFLTQPRDSA